MNTNNTDLYDVMVEGYRFCRSDGRPFDTSVMTFVPPNPANMSSDPPNALVFNPPTYENTRLNDEDDDYFGEVAEIYHVCEQGADPDPLITRPVAKKPFVLAYRCQLSWDTLSEQQRDVVERIEADVNAFREKGIFFRSVIMEGIGGCGKTRLMAYVMNHSPENTHVLYLTKQNKRLQDFLYDELCKGEIVPPRPVVDMSKCTTGDFFELAESPGGRYACSVEKLVYNVGGRAAAIQTNSRKALQWEMNIPDSLFTGGDIETKRSNVVLFLDEYTMISPALLHKMLHCVEILFRAPTVLVMGGDQFQLGPIGWGRSSDTNYRGRCGEPAPPKAVSKNNEYYVSDVREELEKRLKQKPLECQMVGSQRCRDDPRLAEMVAYLRTACRKRTAVKAIARRLAAFGRSRGIDLFRYDAHRRGNNTGRLVFDNAVDGESGGGAETPETDDRDDEDRHLGDNDLRDTSAVKVDWNSPPVVDMKPFIDFYVKLYEEIYTGYTEGSLHDFKLPAFVCEKAAEFASKSFPAFMVKKNDKCNLLSDTFLKTLYNGVRTELEKKCAEKTDTRPGSGGVPAAKRMKLSASGTTLDVKTVMERLCVSISVCDNSPVQQTMMVGVPYRMTDTLKSASVPVISNGELVLLTAITFDSDLSIGGVILKTLQRNTDHFILVRPGLTQNRLNNAGGRQRYGNDTTYMLPMVPMVCENIYQMQGNTIVSDCYVDLLSTKGDDIYVAVSRFQRTTSIKGIVMSE